MIERIWTDLLRLIETLVSPDWGALIALLPISILALVVLYLVWTAIRFMRVGPAKRGLTRRRATNPPAGIHLPGPSYSPIIASVGAAVLFYGLVFGGPVLLVGVVLLALALLYWGREAMREYDRDTRATKFLPPPVGETPPGIHLPGPSFRPVLISIALMILFYGLVFGGLLLVVGFVALALSMIGWLLDANREYRDTLVADATGHMPKSPRPGYPRAILAVFAVLVVGGIVLQTGILPPRSASGTPGSSPGASAPPGSPVPSGGPGSPGPGGPPPGAPSITALNLAFDPTAVTVPAGQAFQLHFANQDAGIPHNVAIHTGGPTGPAVFTGEIFPGVAERVYDVPALQAGDYAFVCTVHPNMTGTLTAQ